MSWDPDELISDASVWLNVPVGDTCTVIGKLESVGYGSPGTLLINFPGWDSMVIHTNAPRDTKPIALGTLVRVRCIREEDGLLATMIRPALGGVPIPLTQ